ncbi:MAG TPA: DegT/DnrJ/EryC1/StrS family aminotransferase [Armatimonadota bacterium]|nr:DegT/DnrJ/EryC1/StrS family aminotransferase [Armatimonadota bacterium]
MKVPVCDLKAGYEPIREQVLQAIDECLQGMQLFLGPNVQALEKSWAEYCAATHCVGLANGTDAIVLLLKAAGVGPGDEVITTPFTFFATIEAIAHVGATPVFVDIDPATFCINAKLIEAAVTPQTKAILAVHLYGHPAEMDTILDIAKRHDLLVFEDAAQAHGAGYKGQRIGSFGDGASFSFYFTKNLGAFGEAGAVTTNRDDIAQVLQELRNHGEVSKYVHERIGYNNRIDEIQAAILNIRLPMLDDYNNARRAIATRYDQALADTSLTLPTEAEGAHHVYHLYVVRSDRRDELAEHLTANEIGFSLHYRRPCHLQEAVTALGNETPSLPIAETLGDEILALPMYPQLTEEQQAYVIGNVREFEGV